MGIFSSFEGKVDDAFDGIAGSVFKSPIEPSQIAKRCEKQMHRNKLVGKGVQYAPTLYTVLVNTDDDRRLFGFYPTMAGEIETYLVGSASDSDLTLECRPLVRFIADDGLKSGKFDVIAEVVTANIISELREEEAEYYGLDNFSRLPVDGNRGQRPKGTRNRQEEYANGNLPDNDPYDDGAPVFDGLDNIGRGDDGYDDYEDDLDYYEEAYDDDYVEPAPSRGAHAGRGSYGYQSAVLVNARSGDRYYLDDENLLLGREETCDIAIPDASVSRAHARLSRDEMGDWSITDLGSMNGTSVNGRKIRSGRLRFGDQITVGTTILLFQKG